MREILFKAKRKNNGEWMEGFLIKDLHEEEWYIGFLFGGGAHDTDVAQINPETLCQYTGLNDKNGNKIWENDICDRKEKYPEVVKQYQGDWVLDYSYVLGKEEGNNYCNLGFYCCERNCVEVIGNIFDNPELIGE